LINDGSKDGSGDICQRYVDNHPAFFRCINQENQGLSVARNTGLSEARGKYILFLDSDDTLTNDNSLSSLLQMSLSQELDIGIGNFKHLYEDGREDENRSLIVADKCSGLDWLYKSLKKRKYLPAVWAKLYKRSFLLETDLLFVPRLINEDQLFTIQALKKAQAVAAENCVFYRYRHRQNSISTQRNWTSDLARAQSCIYIAETLLKETESLEPKFRKLVMERTIKILKSSFLMLRETASSAEQQNSIKHMLIQIDNFHLAQFVRFSRLSHLIDWVLLKKGFQYYLNWRTSK
jgi:glycosyltransferase involved in cell wall biosynthesis